MQWKEVAPLSSQTEETWLTLSVQLLGLSVDEWAQRRTDECCQLCLCVKVTPEQVLTVRTFVGKQIHLCKGHHLFQGVLSLSLFSLHPSLSLLLLCPAFRLLLQPELLSWGIPVIGWLQLCLPGREKHRLQHYQHSVATNLTARPRLATLQLSLDSSRELVLHANRVGTLFSNWLPLALCLHVTHKHTHSHTSHYSQHSSPSSTLSPLQERKLSDCLNWIDNIHMHLANTPVQCKKQTNKHACKILKCKLVPNGCLL